MRDVKQEYIDAVCGQVRNKSVHGRLKAELSDHIERQQAEYMKEGAEPEQALKLAVESMGDPVVTGRRLHKTHRRGPEWSIVAMTLVLTVVGLLLQYVQRGTFQGSLEIVPFGVAALVLAYYVVYPVMRRFPVASAAAFIAALIVLIIVCNDTPGYMSGIYYGYYMSMIFAPVFAGVLHRMHRWGYAGLLLAWAYMLVAGYLFLLSAGISAMLNVALFFTVILTAAVYKNWFRVRKPVALSIIYGPFAIAAVWLWTAVPGVRTRLSVMLNPQLNPLGQGWLAIRVRERLTASHWFGPGDMVAAEYNLSGDNSLLFAATVYRLGYAAGLAVVALLAVMVWRMMTSAFKLRDNSGFMVSFAIGLVFSSQALFFILLNLSIWPTNTVTLPLISYGHVGFVTCMSLVGLTLSAFRNRGEVWPAIPELIERVPRVQLEEGRLIIDLRRERGE